MLTIMYASISEYLIFFGSPIGSEGFSGRYRWAHVYDVMLDGEMWCYTADSLTAPPSNRATWHTCRRGRQGIPHEDHAWMLEYSRGLIPAMLTFRSPRQPASYYGFQEHATPILGLRRNVRQRAAQRENIASATPVPPAGCSKLGSSTPFIPQSWGIRIERRGASPLCTPHGNNAHVGRRASEIRR